MRYASIIAAIVVAFFTSQANADVTVYTNKPEWQAAAGSSTFIGFTGFPSNTYITNQFADLGVLFTDGNDHVQNSPSWSDGSGLISTEFISPYGGRIHLSFLGDRDSLAFDYTGSILVELYSHGQLIATTSIYSAAFTPFVGLKSSRLFDKAIVYDGDDEVVAIDNLYFGPPVPAPGAIFLLGAAALATRRRRTEQP